MPNRHDEQNRADQQPSLSLQERISQQDSWTFSECLGLSADYNMKVRMVIAMVYSTGKTYIERDLKASSNNSEDSPT